MLGKSKSIDVFLRGKRDYVQGTQMIARAVEVLELHGGVLVQANFTKISNRQICVQLGENTDAQRADMVGQLKFQTAQGIKSFLLLETAITAERRDMDMGITCEKRQDLGQLSGSFYYSGVDNFEAALNAVVQCIKTLHEEISPDVSDIWFTGIRRFALPLDWNKDFSSGTIQFNKQRVMRSNDNHQSLLNVKIEPDAKAAPMNGLVTFAFKSTDKSGEKSVVN